MNKKIMMFGISSLALIATASTFSKGVLAYQGDYTQRGPNCTSERHEEMTAALESNDYSAWAALMRGKGRITQVISESNFARFAEAHRLAEEGKYEEANAIRKELGLRTKDGERVGAGYRQGNGQGKRNGQSISN